MRGFGVGSAVSFTSALRTIALSRRGRGVLVLLSDFLVREDLRKGLNYLAGGGFDVHCLQVLSPGELEPEKDAVIGDLRLMDAESGAGAEVTVSGALLTQYKRRVKEHVEHVHAACVSRGMTHVMITVGCGCRGALDRVPADTRVAGIVRPRASVRTG